MFLPLCIFLASILLFFFVCLKKKMLFQSNSLAAFARFYDHVRKLFNFGSLANVIQDGEGF